MRWILTNVFCGAVTIVGVLCLCVSVISRLNCCTGVAGVVINFLSMAVNGEVLKGEACGGLVA